jgi:hypothetical protein
MENTQLESLQGKVGFALGTGRCGTHFIAEVMERESQVSAIHERHPFNDSFHRYCKWYGLPIDHEGFLQTKATAIQGDLQSHPFSFEASAYLSLSALELYDRFKAKFVLLVRSPERVVNSFLHKGWYAAPAIRTDPNRIPSYQNYLKSRRKPLHHLFAQVFPELLDDRSKPAHHFFARIFPSGDKFEQWNQMSRIGKLAWYWNALNTKILEDLSEIPPSHWRVEKLEDLSYARYQELVQFLGFQTQVTPVVYQNLTQTRPGSKPHVPTIENWTAQEISEFEQEVIPMTQRFSYEHRVKVLKS